MELIYTDAQWHDLAVVAGCELDCEFGPGSRNSWQLECPADDAPAMSDGSLLYCDGGEVGGVVDGIAPDTGEGTVTFSGRTWHGVLDGNLIAPAAGQDYKAVEGEANAAIGSLIGEMGISDLFAADPADSGVRVSHQFGRPAATGYQGLVDMLAGSGAKLRTRFDSASRKCVLSAAPKGDYSTEELDGDRISVKIERDWRPVNHLACFGSGELKDRIRLDLYADESGNVSKTQSIFGAKHRCAVYDYSSADAETLEKDGRKKLEELQAADEIQVTLPDDSEYEIGDVVGGREPVTGIYTTATLTRKTVLIDGDGEMDVRYEAGGTASGVSLSNASGGGNGGHAYLAGKGLTLEGYTFSAEVDAESLAAVEAKADGAATAASNASAAAGKAEAFAKAATVAAAANAKAIAGKQDALTAGANVTIDGATISAKDTTYDEATTAKAGLMSALDKKKLDNKVDDTASGVSAALEKLPTWVANPTDSTQLVRRDTNGTAEYGRVTFRTVWSYIKGKADAVYAAVSHRHSAFDVEFSPRSAYMSGVDPVHAGFMGQGRCLSAFLPPSGIKLEYSTDSGATWIDYGADDAYKRLLASMPNSYGKYWLGGPNPTGALGDMLRVTYEPSDGRYGRVQSALVWVSTNGGSNLLCSVETSTIGAKGTWVKRVAPVEMNGWSGPNVVDLPPLTFGGNGYQVDNTYGWRFTFAKKADVPGKTPNVLTIDLYGDVVWAPANEMMRSGHLYTWNDEGKGHFLGSADSATKLKTARKVSISGAVNGSATWDGSGDLSIVVAGDSAAAGFLDAHPVGTYMETSGYDPSDYGGEWSMVPSIGPYTWIRVK